MADMAPDDFVAWVQDARGPLLRSAFLVTGSEALADDLVQEAMIKVAQRWSRLRAGNPTAYASTIIHRDHVTWWRRRRETPIADTVERMSPHDDDLTERATAEVLGVTIGTVKSQTSAALRRLRQHDGLDALRGGDLR